MRPEHEERFRRIAEDYLERPGGDYAELLHHGEVSSPEGVDPERCRPQIREKGVCGQDPVITIRSGDRAIAALRRTVPKDQELAVLSAALERGEVLRGVAERARLLGHEIVRWVAHDEESIAMCGRCQGGIYVRLDAIRPSWMAKRLTRSAGAERPAVGDG